ncbi:MAG TPA: sigma-70 family RNA polymerase sigma factor [Cyclobacteriaceae bacterium]|nr:sigma-70 family RNA polymerase sigma factor [Cyclobacteriaceae bacterium]
MADSVDSTFIQQVNTNLDIARKVSRIYFPDVHDREDVLQEMMYQLWKSYSSFDGRSQFSTWMYRVCLNTALTYRRNKKRRKTESLALYHENIPESQSGNNEEAISMLFRAISSLSSVNKAIVLLYLEDLSYEEIASITGLTKSNVSVRLVRIKKELETLLKEKI